VNIGCCYAVARPTVLRAGCRREKSRLEAFSDGKLAASFGRDVKCKVSPVLYAGAIAVSFFQPWIAGGIYVFVAFLWRVPDRRIERVADELRAGHSARAPYEKQPGGGSWLTAVMSAVTFPGGL
jgi:hypothetical protein